MVTPLDLMPAIEESQRLNQYLVRGVAPPSDGFGSMEFYERQISCLFDGQPSDEDYRSALSSVGWCLHEAHMGGRSDALGAVQKKMEGAMERAGQQVNLRVMERLEQLKNVYTNESTREWVIDHVVADGSTWGFATDLGLRILGAACVVDDRLLKQLRKAAKRESRSRR